MPDESRQARRARERRSQQKSPQQQTSSAVKWSIFVGIGIVAAALLVLGGMALAQQNGSSSANGSIPTVVVPTAVPDKTIDSIQCNMNEQLSGDHHHGHLVLLNRGKSVAVPAGIGISNNHDCLYWLHTHNPDGVIHVEAPHPLTPVLKAFFDVWRQPISATRYGPLIVHPGDIVKTFVNGKPYAGNPAMIKITPHTDIWIEAGPPYRTPTPYAWGNL